MFSLRCACYTSPASPQRTDEYDDDAIFTHCQIRFELTLSRTEWRSWHFRPIFFARPKITTCHVTLCLRGVWQNNNNNNKMITNSEIFGSLWSGERRRGMGRRGLLARVLKCHSALKFNSAGMMAVPLVANLQTPPKLVDPLTSVVHVWWLLSKKLDSSSKNIENKNIFCSPLANSYERLMKTNQRNKGNLFGSNIVINGEWGEQRQTIPPFQERN